MKGRIYLNYANDGAWVFTWEADGMGTQRLTFDTEGQARQYARDNGIEV